MNDKMKPAIIGGGAMFLLSLVTSLSSVLLPQGVAAGLGCCSCLWPIGGGLLAAYLYVSKSSNPVPVGDGAILGALTGLIGGVINLIIGTPIGYMLSRGQMDQMAEQFRQSGVELPSGLIGFPLLIAFGIVGALIGIVLATIGGLIGVSVFEKRKGGGAGVPPPPPPNFGGTQGGGYAPPPSAPPSNFGGR